jgi:hypothetical protein
MWEADEPLAYTSAALTHAFDALIRHAEGDLTVTQVQAELASIGFDLLASPEHDCN